MYFVKFYLKLSKKLIPEKMIGLELNLKIILIFMIKREINYKKKKI